MGIMICPNCGGKVSTTRSDCPHCNYVFKKKICPDCNEEVLEDVKECPICGHYFDDGKKEKSNTINNSQNSLVNEDSIIESTKIENKTDSIDISSKTQNNVIEEKKTISTTILDDKVNENKIVEINAVTNNENTDLNQESKLECPYCKSNDLMMIGINYYMCYVCKNKFLDIYSNTQVSTNNISIPKTSVVSAKGDVLQNENVSSQKESISVNNSKLEENTIKDKNIKEQDDYIQTNNQSSVVNKSVEVRNDLNTNENVSPQKESISIDNSKIEKKSIEAEIIKEQDDYIQTEDSPKKKNKTNIFKRLNCRLIIIISVILVLIIGGAVTAVVLLNIKHYDDFADNIDEYEYKYNKDSDSFIITGVKNYNITKASIPNNVTSIGYSAFIGCTSLTSIEIPKSVKNIDDCAFESCISLESITIPNSVINLGKRLFEGCKSLKSITLPFIGMERPTSTDYNYCFFEIIGSDLEVSELILTDCKYIQDYAFNGCDKLKSVTIPNTVTCIGSGPFTYSYLLTNVYYDGTIEDWCNITVDCPIFNESNIEQKFYLLDANGNVKYNGKNYKLLTELEIPSTITSINNHFYGYNQLTSLTIPNSVTNIGWLAFGNCSSLESVTFNGTKEQWYNIENSDYCFDYTRVKYIKCSDGTINISTIVN